MPAPTSAATIPRPIFLTPLCIALLDPPESSLKPMNSRNTPANSAAAAPASAVGVPDVVDRSLSGKLCSAGLRQSGVIRHAGGVKRFRPARHCSGRGTYAMRYRKNINCLTSDELHDLREALAAMYALPATDPNSFATIASFHGGPPIAYCAHGAPGFFTWHRAYLMAFENALRVL